MGGVKRLVRWTVLLARPILHQPQALGHHRTRVLYDKRNLMMTMCGHLHGPAYPVGKCSTLAQLVYGVGRILASSCDLGHRVGAVPSRPFVANLTR